MKTVSKIAASVLALALSAGMGATQVSEEDMIKFNEQSYLEEMPDMEWFDASTLMPKQEIDESQEVMMLEPMSAETKMRMMQVMMMGNPMSMRDMMNLMVAKKMVLPDITFDEVIESIKSKALDLNMRPTGHNTPYIILRETFDENSPRVEFLSFCDLSTMRLILNYSMEFAAFLPCSIQVQEDRNGQIWITTLDWDARWLDTSANPNRFSDDVRERAISVRSRIEQIMEAGATGDF